MKFNISSINVSTEKGTQKYTVPSAEINEEGIVGDAHSGKWHRQISLLSKESINTFNKKHDRELKYGEFAENLTVEGIDLSQMAIFDRIKIGDVELEISQIGKTCHGDGCSVYREVGKCVMPKDGLFARVIKGGMIKTGDTAEFIEKPLKIVLFTLSDRAAKGEYQDISGPVLKEQLNDFFQNRRWHTEITNQVLTDDMNEIQNAFKTALKENPAAIFTTGGTGVGPRDNAPEAITPLLDKQIPGIMDFIRVKYGDTIPNARLSRSVAGIAGTTQVYLLPGSVKAVKEYVSEITKTFEHIIFMIAGLDIH